MACLLFFLPFFCHFVSVAFMLFCMLHRLHSLRQLLLAAIFSDFHRQPQAGPGRAERQQSVKVFQNRKSSQIK